MSSQQAAQARRISRAKLYRWERRPKNVRRSVCSAELEQAIQEYRERHGCDREKLAMLLKRDG